MSLRPSLVSLARATSQGHDGRRAWRSGYTSERENDMATNVLFTERQHYTQVWVWVLVLGVAALFWYGVWNQLVLGEPWGSNPASDRVLFVSWLLAGLALPILFAFTHLRTEVRSNAICVRFFPFHLRRRCWILDELESVTAREYSGLLEFGGWGIRIGPSGWAYNVKGRLGVQLRFRSGKKILIGTQDPEGFVAALDQASGRGVPRGSTPDPIAAED